LSGVIVTGAQASVWICWGAVDAGTATTGSWTKVQYVGNFSKGVPFTAVVTGMGTNTTYWYRFYLSNAAGIGWSGAAAMFNGSPVKTNGEWSPSNLVAVAWYDASDSNSLTLVSGKVSQWGDKSGNNRHAAQGTTGSQPTYRAADTRMNNLPSIGYDNAYRWLRTPVMAFSNVYVVTYYDAATFNNWMPLLGDGVDQGHEMRGYNGRLELNTGRGFAFYRDGATTTTAACPQVATLWRAAATTNLGNYAWFVLGGPATWQYWNYGAVSELIFTDGTEGLPVQQMIEGYMAHKWQIDGNLPADHPYKNHPPGGGESVAVANLAPTAIADSAATLNANISTHSTNADVYVHWGLSDGGTNANGWMSSVKVETYTNVTTNLFYTATGLNPGQTYYYTFRATNETTNLWASPSWSFRTSGQTSILAPSNLSATPGSGLINLTWTDTSTNETGFRVERSLSGMSGFTAIGGATANATNYTDSAVSPGPIYYYRIAATNVTESSVVSGTASASLPKLSATVTISNTNQVYDGTPRSVSYATVPAELAADITYGGSPSTPVDAGTYTVVVTINDATYEGAATGTLVVAKVTPTVTAWPTAASIVEGQSLFYSELTGGNASVPGTFGFDTPSYPPPRGINPVDVTFEADDAVNYFSVGGTVDVVVAEYHQDPPLINHQGWTTNGTTGANLSSVLVAGDSASIWVCWGALDGGTASVGNWDHVDAVGNFGEGEPFTAHVTGLATNTTYWYRFYGTNAAGTCWSDTAIAFNGSPVGTDEPWTPVEMATAAWYDAADTNTLWADTTGLTKATTKVARWDDKSGYNRHVTQTNSTQQPSYASSVITFDGTTNMLFNSSPFAYAMGAVDVYVVAAVNTNSGMRIVSENWTSTDNTLYTPAQTRTGSGTAMSAYVRNDTGSTNATGIRFEGTNALSATGSFNRTTPNLYHWRDAATNFAGRVAGGSPTTVSYTRLGTVTVDRFAIGAIGPRPSSPNGSAFVNAGLREIVITGILSDSDRQKMEGYLAHKWTLAGNLPSGHPYKTQPPGSGAVTVENLAPAAILGSTATLNAVVSALSTNVDAYVHWGLSDGGTNAGSWTHSAKVGSYTNASANVGYPAEGLSSGQTYYYTFSISNASAHVWASPSWTFRTPGTGGSCLLTVSSPYGFPNPSGATPHSLGSSIDAVLSGSPVVTGQTQYVCTGWTATGSGLTSGPGTNVSFTITTDTTITWQWTTNYWVELFIHGE